MVFALSVSLRNADHPTSSETPSNSHLPPCLTSRARPKADHRCHCSPSMSPETDEMSDSSCGVLEYHSAELGFVRPPRQFKCWTGSAPSTGVIPPSTSSHWPSRIPVVTSPAACSTSLHTSPPRPATGASATTATTTAFCAPSGTCTSERVVVTAVGSGHPTFPQRTPQR